jgi:uncharacterized membrane protein
VAAAEARSRHRLERAIGLLLRAGVSLAAALVASGGALYLARHGADLPDYRVFHGEPADLRSPAGLLAGARELHGRILIQLGLLVLLATPVARVALSLAAFARERDGLYLGVTLLVLLVLLYSILGARL